LIFEDDVVLRDDAGEWMRRIVPQLDATPWDVFYLGLRLEEAGDRYGENLLQVRRGFHTHAYAVARRAIPRLIATIDRILATLSSVFDGYEDPELFKVCALPILAIQEPNHSHTHGVWVDRTADYFAHFDRDDFRRNCREMQSWPQTKEVSSQRAVELLQAGRSAEAQAVCRRSLILNPDDAEALHALGLIAHQAGHSEDSLRLIGRAIQIDPRDLRYHVNLAVVLGSIGRPAEAVEPLRAAVKLRRNLPELHYKLGAILETIGRLAESATAYRDAIALRPNFVEAQHGLQRVIQGRSPDGGSAG
jgi:tetratricopeptide (TPR) repeat protein